MVLVGWQCSAQMLTKPMTNKAMKRVILGIGVAVGMSLISGCDAGTAAGGAAPPKSEVKVDAHGMAKPPGAAGGGTLGAPGAKGAS
jgi:hypothetical protein